MFTGSLQAILMFFGQAAQIQSLPSVPTPRPTTVRVEARATIIRFEKIDFSKALPRAATRVRPAVMVVEYQ
jgi:hypothetical protein